MEAMGYRLVHTRFADGKRKTLSIMAERSDGVMMSFDDCADITNAVSALLDVEDPISGAYNLEVCSPGIDRPLTRRDDYSRFAGKEAKIETIIPVDGRKRFRGIIKGIDGDAISLAGDEGSFSINFPLIRTAKLVPEDMVRPKPKAKPQKAKKAG